MAGYRWPIPPADRSIIAYVRDSKLERRRPAQAPATPAAYAGSRNGMNADEPQLLILLGPSRTSDVRGDGMIAYVG